MRAYVVNPGSSMSRTNIQKAKQQDVYRLTDMLVEEVSLVDRAANQRKFLVVKRSDQMGTELTNDGKGNLTKNRTRAIKAMEVPPGFKEMVGPLLTKAAERLDALNTALGQSSPADVDDEGTLPQVPAEFSSELTAIMSMLDRCNNLFPAAPPETDSDAPTEDAPSELQMRAAVDNVVKVYGNPKVTKAAIEKVGAKMSKERLTRFDQAMQVLAGLRGELTSTDAGAAAKAKDPKEEKDPTKKAATSPLEAKLDSLIAGFGEMAKGVTAIATTVKAHGQAIESVSKSRGAGNGAAVEAPQPLAKAAAEDDNFSWPRDMNNPVNRETVGKTESFFDND